MQLPAEVRNRIYRLCTCAPGTIHISKASWTTHQPALLRTGYEIRAEALKLFYFENSFLVDVPSWDGTAFSRFLKLRAKYDLKT